MARSLAVGIFLLILVSCGSTPPPETPVEDPEENPAQAHADTLSSLLESSRSDIIKASPVSLKKALDTISASETVLESEKGREYEFIALK